MKPSTVCENRFLRLAWPAHAIRTTSTSALQPEPMYRALGAPSSSSAAEPVTGIDPDPDGDGILAEYLIVDWFQGQGEHFQQTFTRQFTFVDEDGHYGIKVWYSDV
jgi:hypothetical protein